MSIKESIKRTPMVSALAGGLYRWIGRQRFVSSREYWRRRYRVGGNSGSGSKGLLAQFKSEVLSSLLARYEVSTVVEWGCGDGRQLALLDRSAIGIKRYVGIDVSADAIAFCREQFNHDPGVAFGSPEELVEMFPHQAEASLSLDVIYHLVEDDEFENYMGQVFSSASRVVIIYSSDNAAKTKDAHVRHRKFTDWVSTNAPTWRLVEKIKNRYPFNPREPDSTSFSDFYVFEKV